MRKWLLIIIMSASICCCNLPGYRSYTIMNYSNDTMTVYLATGFYEFGKTAFPDTLLPRDYPISKERMISEYIVNSIIPPHSSTHSVDLLYKDGSLGEKLPRDTFSVFFIKRDTLMKYGYEDVRKNNRIAVRYDLSTYEVRQILDYNFPYPPQSYMSEMKMSPPYESFIQH